MEESFRRKSQVAWGISLICLLFFLETWNADRVMPHPATPFVWGLLGVAGTAALLSALWYGRKARQARLRG
ncbi:MAG: hypothetical protein JNM33_06785 [Rubrivivax sp.]|nr:hypothetical protein [Rubrivivax sp.]